MKKITLFVFSFAIALSAYPQSGFKHEKGKLSAITKQPVSSAQRVKTAEGAASAAIYKPLHEEEYEYFEGVWEKLCDYYYEYDKRGNALVTTSDDGETKNRTTQTYNSDNLFVEKVEEVAEDGTNFVNSTRQTRKFDSKEKNLVVELQSFQWMNDQWEKYGNGNKRDIARDAQGNVTEVVISTWYLDNYSPVLKQTVTYNDRGLAGTWRQDAMTETSEWKEELTLNDIEWFKTDGQITSDNFMDFFAGNNCLKSAKVTEGTVQTGTIKAKYDESGATNNRTVELTYLPTSADEVLGQDVYTYAYTDNNGSMTITQNYYEDADGDKTFSAGELLETYVTTVTYDAHGNMTLLESTENGELGEGEKYEYVYDEQTGALKESLVYMLNYDTMEYEPMMKIVADQFVDVTSDASVEEINAAKNAVKEVYTLQGVKVGNSIDNLPSGVYIVKEGADVEKVIKRR